MVKTVGVITVFVLFLITFFLGVNYSDSVRKQYSWMFEKEEALDELPAFERQDLIDAKAAKLEEAKVEAIEVETSEEVTDNTAPDAQDETIPIITNNDVNTTE